MARRDGNGLWIVLHGDEPEDEQARLRWQKTSEAYNTAQRRARPASRQRLEALDQEHTDGGRRRVVRSYHSQIMRGLTARLADAALIARAVAEDPVESLLNVQARIAERDELRGKRTRGGGFMPWPPCPYEADEDAEQKLHELVGAPWPCPLTDQFWQIWSETIAPLEERGLKLGRGSFAGWGDGEPGLVRAVWCLTHHLRPKDRRRDGRCPRHHDALYPRGARPERRRGPSLERRPAAAAVA